MKWKHLAMLGLLFGSPAVAQEWQVARERFAFAGSRLTIRVEAEMAGTLRVIRGGSGSVQVAGRAERGFTGAGLDDTEELTLTAAGVGPVDYMVSVPADVWVDVRLPGRSFAESMAGSTRSRTFEWTPDPPRSGRRARPPSTPGAPGSAAPSLYTTYSRPTAPGHVSLPSLLHVRSLELRIEEGPFRVRTSRPLSVERGDGDRLEIHADPPAMAVVITVPRRTRTLRLDAAGATALLMREGSVTVSCRPVTDQRLSDDRRWLTFTPTDGRLACAP